jgi:peptidoglycan/LPS O-acetylase OafA/YrhL
MRITHIGCRRAADQPRRYGRDLFFTLSGFIIVYVYRDGVMTESFIVKRLARLYPVHFVTLMAMVLMIVVGRLWGVPVNADVERDDLFTHLLMLHGSGLNDSLALNYPSWSISAEFFAYLAFPFLLPLVMTTRLVAAIPVVLGFFVICVVLADLSGRPLHERTYDFSLLRIIPEFLMGMLAARLCLERKITGKSCAVVAVLLFLVGLMAGQRLMVILGAPFLIAALYFFKGRIPEPMRYLGIISYSLYMVHALVEKVGFTLLEGLLGAKVLPTWTVFLTLGIAILCAAILYHWIELPAQRFLLSAYRKHVRPLST